MCIYAIFIDVPCQIIFDYRFRKILVSASKLPSPPQIGDPGFPIPESVSEWLKRISLQDYESRFKMNGYENMDRVRAIWEFELTTVSKKILNSTLFVEPIQ